MPICGPNCSLCGLILSVWGVIQLGLMGLFYYVQAATFVEDLAVDVNEKLSFKEQVDTFNKDLDTIYNQTAYNCWIAAGLYAVLLVFSAQQFYANTRGNKL